MADDLQFVTAACVLSKQQFLALLRAIYTGFPDWHYEHGQPEFRQETIAVKFRQGGHHTGILILPGLAPVEPTGKSVAIPEHFFFYKLDGNQIAEIRPEPIAGGAPAGILEQIGVPWPPRTAG